MWTERKYYLNQLDEISAYLSEQAGFAGFLLGSFSYQSQEGSLSLTIEEDQTAADATNSLALMWDLRCEGVTDFLAHNLTGLSKWKISEILLEEGAFLFQVGNGYLSFKAQSASLGIPGQIKQFFIPQITKLQLDYILQEFRTGLHVDETAFSFETDDRSILRYIGYREGEAKPYWAGLSDFPDGQSFQTAEELFQAKIYDGQSLKERWDEVRIYSIEGLSLDDWLTSVPHFVETTVSESEDDYYLYINGVQLNGFIEEDYACKTCGTSQCYLDDYDEYFCPACNLWMSGDWWDDEDEHYFKKRPLEPALLWRPNKLLTFCQVEFEIDGKAYTYYCPDSELSVGDWVQVPVGRSRHQKAAQITKIFQAPANQPPYPLDKVKTLGKKLEPLTEQVAERLATLLGEGLVCDLSGEKLPADSSLAYDVLKTPIGHFWLELNDSPIKMSLVAHYPEDEDYGVEATYSLKPYVNQFEDFHSLKICTDIDLRKARRIDNLSEEHKDGYQWQLGAYDIGLAGHTYSYLETELDETLLGLPYYVEWDDLYKDLYSFTVAWKYYESDDDLSIWFNT